AQSREGARRSRRLDAGDAARSLGRPLGRRAEAAAQRRSRADVSRALRLSAAARVRGAARFVARRAGVDALHAGPDAPQGGRRVGLVVDPLAARRGGPSRGSARKPFRSHRAAPETAAEAAGGESGQESPWAGSGRDGAPARGARTSAAAGEGGGWRLAAGKAVVGPAGAGSGVGARPAGARVPVAG